MPTLVPRISPSGIHKRSHSDTSHDAGSLEQSFSPSLEESARIIPSGVPKRDTSYTPRYAHSLESGYFPRLEESVTFIILQSHKPSITSSAVPTGKVSVMKS